MVLNKNELLEIRGGSLLKYTVIGGIITFLIGCINGFLRPLPCGGEK